MNSNQLEEIQKEYKENLRRFQNLIEAQDCVRRVWCVEKGEVQEQLKIIDRLLTKQINHFGSKIGHVTNEN